MSYTALEQMGKINRKAYGIPFPGRPEAAGEGASGELEERCAAFLRDSCEALRFDPERAALTDRDGRSAGPNQIPFNMEKDVDRLCLENALRRFLRSGAAEDAFDVYFCYLEIFLGGYARTRKMIELLAEFESNASALLMKHRDHYSHSVYVFSLGLAVYETSGSFRAAYGRRCGLSGQAEAHHFLRYWGLTALFHDIGYPFELPFEEVKSYFGGTVSGVPFVAYKGLAPFIRLEPEESRRFAELLGGELPEETLNGVLALAIASDLGGAYGLRPETLCAELLDREAGEPERFGGFMDHAYFSAVLLFHKFREILGPEAVGAAELDAFSAAALHNSLFRFSIQTPAHPQPLEMDRQPLAYLLMLCDELQCWDRTAYGQNSRLELHPMDCAFRFGPDSVAAVYLYDSQLENRKDTARGSYRKMTGSAPVFTADIGRLVRLGQPGAIALSAEARFAPSRRPGNYRISHSSFLHLYSFAEALNERYLCGGSSPEPAKMEADFDALSLEYKLSNLLQAKAFAGYLDAIGCFYTDRPAPYALLERFTDAELGIIGPLEHSRWLREKRSMGWRFGTDYLGKPDSRRVRELTRTHRLLTEDYAQLDAAERIKDTEPMNTLLRLMAAWDGLRIYRL